MLEEMDDSSGNWHQILIVSSSIIGGLFATGLAICTKPKARGKSQIRQPIAQSREAGEVPVEPLKCEMQMNGTPDVVTNIEYTGTPQDRIRMLARKALQKERKKRKEQREERRRLAILNGEQVMSSESSMSLRSDDQRGPKTNEQKTLDIGGTRTGDVAAQPLQTIQPTQSTATVSTPKPQGSVKTSECHTANQNVRTAEIADNKVTIVRKQSPSTPLTSGASSPPNNVKPLKTVTKKPIHKKQKTDKTAQSLPPSESQTVERAIPHNPKYVFGGKSVDVKPETSEMPLSMEKRSDADPDVQPTLKTATTTVEKSAKTQSATRTQESQVKQAK
ncbi:hypothetical protein M3Y96_00085200 [Aphelenchoides besseyi]|nr:hypothetical protein M3Y96_00085200 [Aphelenchoides besseyi]